MLAIFPEARAPDVFVDHVYAREAIGANQEIGASMLYLQRFVGPLQPLKECLQLLYCSQSGQHTAPLAVMNPCARS